MNAGGSTLWEEFSRLIVFLMGISMLHIHFPSRREEGAVGKKDFHVHDPVGMPGQSLVPAMDETKPRT